MKRLIQVFVLLLGVSLYSQDTLSVKDGAYGFDKDFNLDLHITTATGIKALQFDIKYDGTNFNYKSQYALVKERLGGEDSDHVITVKEVVSGTVRVLIYSPSNKLIPTGAGKLLSVDFHSGNNYGYFDFQVASVVASKEDNTNLNLKLEKGVITILAPSFGFSSKAIAFGSIYKGTVSDKDFALKNVGTDTLTVSLEKDELTKFALTDFDTKTTTITWPQKIYPGSELKINARFDSSISGIFSEKLSLKTNDPNSEANKVEDFIFSAKAYNDNRITVESSVEAYNKQSSDIKVSINGDEDVTSFQFDITPQDSKIGLVSSSAALLKSGTDHVISSNIITDSKTGVKSLRVVVYSPSNALFTQPIGEVVKFSIRPDKILIPALYSINISNSVLTNKDLTNVVSESENGSINLITGKLAFDSPVTGDDSKREYTLDLGELNRNSYNEKSISYTNSGNKKLILSGVSSSNPDVSITGTFPVETDADGKTSQNYTIIPSGSSDDFSAYIKFTHDGGSEIDSVLITASLANRNKIVVRNTNVSKAITNTVPISMLNSNEIKGMQFDLTLPKETKPFTWTLSASTNDDFEFAEITDGDGNKAKDPGISHYVGDEINFINNAGSTHPLYIVTGFNADGGYDSTKQLAGVTNQGATSGTVKVDLSEVAPGTYYYICGNHKSMQGTITILPKFSISANSSNLVADRSTDFILTQSTLGARKYRFLIYSNSNSLFTGNRGNIINLPLSIASISNSDMDIVDGSYDLVLDNIIISGKDNANVSTKITTTGVIIIGGTNALPPVITPNQSPSLKENSSALTYFYKIKATDADEDSYLDDFKIVSGNDDGIFGVIPETGELYVVKPVIDYETKSSYSLVVTVSDGTKTSAEEAIVIKITDDPNAFVVNNFTVKIFSSSGKKGISNDSDIRTTAAGDVFLYELKGGSDKDLFTIDSSTGKLTFNAAPTFSSPSDSNKDNLYELSIKSLVIDDTSNSFPVITSEKTVSIAENSTDALTVSSILSSTGSDVDGDGIVDSLDNCPNTANSNQRDGDSNGEGDVCEDSDGDGVLDYKDVCPYIPNPDQKDSDFDGVGDVCDDSDGDGIYDPSDNCPSISNSDQSDIDGDGIGDVCDNDKDGDTILNDVDNCPTVANTDQADSNSNGIGDVCEDSDGDGIYDVTDNCLTTANTDQADMDSDGIGDVCDDSDGDTIFDSNDNCPTTANTDQADIDSDGIGDVCDDDKDGDTILNDVDNCPTTANTDQADIDSDGIGDVCDDDKDGDTILNDVDNCPTIANTDQADLDEDGIGDVCDDDKDGDTILNDVDNCPTIANTDQADIDSDGIGDVCDDDKDGDTILNDVDNCPTTANTDQADFDSDGLGDVCDTDADGDGILNTEDDCANTPLGSKVNTKGCVVFELPVNNNKVEVTSATCIGTTDGSIGLSVEDASFDYSITVTGKDDPVAITGENKTASITGLAAGTYSVCFKVTGQEAYEQCFEVVIGEPKALSAFIDIDNDNKSTSIQLGGSNNYNIEVNGERFEVKGDNFNTTLPTGLSIIKISTNLDCQGVIEKEIFISEDIHYYPNPTQKDVNVHVSGEDTRVMVSVFSEKGDLIYSKEQQIQDFSRKTNINLSRQITGTYIVVMEGRTVRKTFKIVKR